MIGSRRLEVFNMIPVAEPDLTGNELKYVSECIKSGWISSRGKFVKEFEDKFAKFCDSTYGVSVSNGTVALHLALVALGITKGDEVIIPDLTFAASANAVLHTGATPILVDVDKETWNIDINKIEGKISVKTKAIMPVHLYGFPCDMEKIMSIAKKHNLFVIEDCAEAHGAMFNNKKVGSFGDIACFSFYGNKIMTTGEGGICTTNNKELAQKMQMLKDHGMQPDNRYWHEVIGYNYRMTNIQAAIGLAQLERIEKMIQAKIKVYETYNKFLKDVKGITLAPLSNNQYKGVYWMYSILIEDNFGINRDELMKKLQEKDIDTRRFFYPLHEMPPYKINKEFPISTELSKKGINLPSSTNLSEEQIKFICETIKSCSN